MAATAEADAEEGAAAELEVSSCRPPELLRRPPPLLLEVPELEAPTAATAAAARESSRRESHSSGAGERSRLRGGSSKATEGPPLKDVEAGLLSSEWERGCIWLPSPPSGVPPAPIAKSSSSKSPVKLLERPALEADRLVALLA